MARYTNTVLHWDGKVLSDITGRQSVDRFPILVSGYEVYQLLGVPKLNHGTGEETSQAVVRMLKDWGGSQVKSDVLRYYGINDRMSSRCAFTYLN